MECNKDEAKRAMDIAEKKLSEDDYVVAKKFVSKAQNLYPQLDGLKQVSMMIHVYISAANKINGGRETDWYGVLGVDPLADDEALKKQYKKLALLLHPDKNKCKGAEGAFKLVLNAWSLLSDKVKRTAFDRKRKLNTGMQKPPPNQRRPASSNGNQNARYDVDPSSKVRSNQPASGPQRPPYVHKPASSSGNQNARRDGVHPSAKARSNHPASGPPKPPNPHKPAFSSVNKNARDGVHPSANTRSNKHAPPPAAPVNSPKQGNDGMFWTMCNGCKTRSQFRRDRYLKKTITCLNCGQAYIATEQNPCDRYVRQQQWSAQNQATNKNTNGASSSRKFSSPFVGVTDRYHLLEICVTQFNYASSLLLKLEQQWSAQNQAAKKNGRSVSPYVVRPGNLSSSPPQ